MQFQVRDTGSSIPAACLAQIFEPLYTTPEREARVNRLKMKDQCLSHLQTLLVFRAFLTPFPSCPVPSLYVLSCLPGIIFAAHQ